MIMNMRLLFHHLMNMKYQLFNNVLIFCIFCDPQFISMFEHVCYYVSNKQYNQFNCISDSTKVMFIQSIVHKHNQMH